MFEDSESVINGTTSATELAPSPLTKEAAAVALAGGVIGSKKVAQFAKAASVQGDPDTRRLSQDIADLIGLSAEFKLKGKGGELRIRFSEFYELDALFKKLGIGSID